MHLPDLPDLARRPVRREPLRIARRALRHVTGTLLGLALGPLLILSALATLARWDAPFDRLRSWETWRLERFYQFGFAQATATFLTARRAVLHGLLAGVLGYVMAELLLLVVAVVLGSFVQVLIARPVVFGFDFWVISRPALPVLLIFGGSSLLASAVSAELAAWLHAALLGRWSTVVRGDALETRISRLLTTRRGVVLAIDEERRRIERDLHDGVQQNVVSLSVTLARARRAAEPERSAALLEQAHTQSQALIEEVRQVAWRVYPNALDEHGLASALDDVASSSAVPVQLEHHLERELPRAVESAAYFLVRETVTNVVKHARASLVRVRLCIRSEPTGDRLQVTVTDDGIGGADPEGGGLQGLARRVAALDGTVNVDSPPGGPSVITAEIPCD